MATGYLNIQYISPNYSNFHLNDHIFIRKPRISVLETGMNNKDTDHIEETLAHQEQQINDLSEMIIAQGKDIEALKLYIRDLKSKIEMLEDDAGETTDQKPLSVTEQAARDKPPHY